MSTPVSHDLQRDADLGIVGKTMPETRALIGQVAGIVSLIGFVPYLASVLRKKTRPNRATWWIWTVVGTILCASYYASGARHSIWVPVSYMIGPLCTALVSIKYGEGGWTRFDRFCFGGAGASLLLWALSGSALVALIANITIDLLGALPTVKKAYAEPESEDRLSWTLFFVSNALNLLAVETWTIATALYPLYLFTICGIITMILLLRRGKTPATSLATE